MSSNQVQVSKVFDKFLENYECVENFIETVFNNIEIKENTKNLKVCMLNEFKICSTNKLEGFVISNNIFDLVVLNPSCSFVKFWNERNFFAYRYGLEHYGKNDKKKRYLVNFLPNGSRPKNCIDTFDRFNNYEIINISYYSENLLDWLKTIYDLSTEFNTFENRV